MSADSDSGLIKSFIVVLGGLVLFTACIMFLARVIAPPAAYDDKLVKESLQKRIEPVGQVRTSADAAEPAEAAVAAAPKTAKELYDGICASCHATGVAGAPKVDDAAEWAKRGEVGVDTLVATVISGKGAMPPKGGSTYSEDEIRSVVQMLLGLDSGEAAAAEEPAAEAPATEEAAPEAGAAEQAPVEEAAAAAGAEEIPEQVKSTVDTVCSACHIAGVAGAPKFGDKAAWDQRAAAGMETMVATVVSGKGAMPPRGGTQLTEDERQQAIGYMMSK